MVRNRSIAMGSSTPSSKPRKSSVNRFDKLEIVLSEFDAEACVFAAGWGVAKEGYVTTGGWLFVGLSFPNKGANGVELPEETPPLPSLTLPKIDDVFWVDDDAVFEDLMNYTKCKCMGIAE